MFCTHCGKEFSEKDVFCGSCGDRIHKYEDLEKKTNLDKNFIQESNEESLESSIGKELEISKKEQFFKRWILFAFFLTIFNVVLPSESDGYSIKFIFLSLGLLFFFSYRDYKEAYARKWTRIALYFLAGWLNVGFIIGVLMLPYLFFIK